MLETLGAPPPPPAPAAAPREVEAGTPPAQLPLARATAVRAFEPFDDEAEAARWLARGDRRHEEADRRCASPTGIGLLNRALHAQAVAAADPHRAGADAAAGGRGAARLRQRRAGRRRRVQRGARGRRRGWRRAPPAARRRAAPAGAGRRRARRPRAVRRLRDAAAARPCRPRRAAARARPRCSCGSGSRRCWPSCAAPSPTLATRRTWPSLKAAATRQASWRIGALRGDLDAESRKQARELLEICERVLRRRRVLRP